MIYTVNRVVVIGEGGEIVTAYGIEAWENGKKVAASAEPDVFFDRVEAENFAKLCTKLELAPESLNEAIEDALGK